MAYQAGTTTGPRDLGTKMKNFLVANGWTCDKDWTQGANTPLSATDYIMILHKGTTIVHVVADERWNVERVNIIQTPILEFHMGQGTVNTSAAYSSPPGSATAIGQSDVGGRPFAITLGQFEQSATCAYHFFYYAAEDSFYVWLELQPTIWRMVAFGATLQGKMGTWNGGQWMTGSQDRNINKRATTGSPFYSSIAYHSRCLPFGNQNCSSDFPNLFVNSDIDGAARWFNNAYRAGSPTAANHIQTPVFGTTGGNSLSYTHLPQVPHYGYFQDFSGSNVTQGASHAFRKAYGVGSFGGFAPLLPIPIYFRRTPYTTAVFSMVGYAPKCFLTNLSFMSPGQEYIIGGKKYRAFPNYQKKDGNWLVYGYTPNLAGDYGFGLNNTGFAMEVEE